MTFTAMDHYNCGEEDSDPELVQMQIQDYNAIFESDMGTSENGSLVQTPTGAAFLSLNNQQYADDPYQFRDESASVFVSEQTRELLQQFEVKKFEEDTKINFFREQITKNLC